MKSFFLLILISFISLTGFSQQYNLDSAQASLKMKKDSTLHALKKQRDSSYYAQLHGDTLNVDKEFKEKTKWEKLKSVTLYPVFKAGDESGVIPVKYITETPDPKMDYKLLFELITGNPDSVAKQINFGLTEIARKMNLHVAAGVPLKKIFPVIVAHGPGLMAFTTNEFYKEKFKTDNPNLKIIRELEEKGAKFIACGQAMAFIDIKKEALLPVMKVALSAQTVLSDYMLRGYVLYKIW